MDNSQLFRCAGCHSCRVALKKSGKICREPPKGRIDTKRSIWLTNVNFLNKSHYCKPIDDDCYEMEDADQEGLARGGPESEDDDDEVRFLVT